MPRGPDLGSRVIQLLLSFLFVRLLREMHPQLPKPASFDVRGSAQDSNYYERGITRRVADHK